MKDIFGNILEVGDTVAFNWPGYKQIITGTITKFTPKGVTIIYIDPVNTHLSISTRTKTTNERPGSVVKYVKKED